MHCMPRRRHSQHTPFPPAYVTGLPAFSMQLAMGVYQDEGTHSELHLLPLPRQAVQRLSAVSQGDFAQLMEIVQPALQRGWAQILGLLIYPLGQPHAVGVHLGLEALRSGNAAPTAQPQSSSVYLVGCRECSKGPTCSYTPSASLMLLGSTWGWKLSVLAMLRRLHSRNPAQCMCTLCVFVCGMRVQAGMFMQPLC